MTDHPDFIARNLVRTYSDSLRNAQSSDRETSPPRHRLEDALIEEVERQDALAALLQDATARFVVATGNFAEKSYNDHVVP